MRLARRLEGVGEGVCALGAGVGRRRGHGCASGGREAVVDGGGEGREDDAVLLDVVMGLGGPILVGSTGEAGHFARGLAGEV